MTLFARRAALAGILLCSLAVQRAQAETFTDPAGRFVIELPAGWISETPAQVAARDTLAGPASGRNWHYVGAFVPDGELTETSPYIIVQWTEVPIGKLSWDELEREFSAERMETVLQEAEDEVEALFGEVEIGRLVLDRGRGRLLLRMDMDTPDGRREIASTGFLGIDGVAQIHCYAIEGEMSDAAPHFDAVLRGFRFDEGERFTGEGGGLDWGAILVRGLLFAVIGGIVAAIARAGTRRKKRGAGQRTTRGRRAE
jgi:hypothetical protein